MIFFFQFCLRVFLALRSIWRSLVRIFWVLKKPFKNLSISQNSFPSCGTELPWTPLVTCYYLPWRFSLNPFADFTSHETSWYHDVMNPNLTSSWCRRCHMYTKVPLLVPSVVHSVSGKGKLATQSDSRAFRFSVSFLILISWYLILVFAFFYKLI